MNWSDEGFLLSKTRFNENSLIAELFTKDKGKISGIIFGGTSKKIKNYLQVGNKLHVNYNSKNENRIGYFKIEILNAYTPLYFDHKQKLSCITSAMNLIKILTAESQSNDKIYLIIQNLFLILKEKDWLKKYIFWELELLKILGYDLALENFVEKDIEVNDLGTLLNGLKLVGDYLDKTILRPNNLNYPNSRLLFLNTLK